MTKKISGGAGVNRNPDAKFIKEVGKLGQKKEMTMTF